MQVPAASRRPVSASLTPLIDVVFLLIIFFLVSSHLARQEHHLPVDLPVSETKASALDADQTLVITVDSEGKIYVGGRSVETAEWKLRLVDFAAASEGRGAVRIRADGDNAYATIEPILRHAARSGLNNTSIAAVTPDSK